MTGLMVAAGKFGYSMLSPLLPGPVKAVSDVVVHELTSYFGFDQPRSISASAPMLVGPSKDFSAANGLAVNSMLSLNPDAPPGCIFSSTIGDDMSHKDYSAQESYYAGFGVDSTMLPGVVVFSMPVNPKAVHVTGAHAVAKGQSTGADQVMVCPTNQSVMCTPYTRWRGTMHYRFFCSASAFHTCRIRVFFVPGADSSYVLPTIPAVDVYNQTFEFSGNSEAEFSIPFQFPLPYAQQSIGRMCVQVLNPPGTVGDTPPASAPMNFMVFVKTGPDLELCDPSGLYWLDADNWALGPPSGVSELEPQSLLLGPDSAVAVNGGPYTNENVAGISELIRKPSLYHVDVIGASETVNDRIILPPVWGPNPLGTNVNYTPAATSPSFYSTFPSNITKQPDGSILLFDSSQATLPYDGLSYGIYALCPLAAFSQYYWFWRGAIRYTALWEVDITNQTFQNFPQSSLTALPGNFVSQSKKTMYFSAQTLPLANPVACVAPFQPADPNCSQLAVEVPYKSMALFANTGQPQAITLAAGAVSARSYAPLRIFTAAGDDFRFILPYSMAFATLVSSRIDNQKQSGAPITQPWTVFEIPLADPNLLPWDDIIYY